MGKDKNNDLVSDLKGKLQEAEKARDKLNEQVFQFEQIFENFVPLCVTDKDFNIIKINEAYARFFNKKTGNCLEEKCFLNRPVAACHTRNCPLRVILEGKTDVVTYEESRKNAEGEEVPYLVMAKPFFGHNGEIAGIVESFHDVIHEKALEKKLHESEDFLEVVFNAIQDGISVIDPDLNILRVNKTMGKWYPNKKIIGSKCYDLYHDRDEPCDICPTLKALKSGKLEKDEVPLPLGDGKFGVLELYAFPMKDDNGKIVGIVEYVRNISERVRAEESRNNLIDELSKAISEIKELRGILPICSYCKKIRNDGGYWDQLEQYISHHTDAQFSHTICLDCLKKEHPDIYAKRHEVKDS